MPDTDIDQVTIDAVVPVYGGWQHVEPCLKALASQTYPVNVIVIDDCGPDDTADRVAAAFPELTLLRNETNRGFAATCNRGIREGSADVVVLVNSDVIAEATLMADIAAAFEAAPADVASVCPLLTTPAGLVDSQGITADPTCAGFVRFHGAPLSRQNPADPIVLGPYGAVAAYRRRALDEVGLLDEGIYMYGEELDLALRLRAGGYGTRALDQPGRRAHRRRVGGRGHAPADPACGLRPRRPSARGRSRHAARRDGAGDRGDRGAAGGDPEARRVGARGAHRGVARGEGRRASADPCRRHRPVDRVPPVDRHALGRLLVELMSLTRRLLSFSTIPAFSALIPFLVLPVLARAAGVDAWVAIAVGQSVGGFLALAVALGLNVQGPTLVALAPAEKRAELFARGTRARILILLPALVIGAVAAWLLAPDGSEIDAALMAVAITLGGLTSSWYLIGLGTPLPLIGFELLPRAVATGLGGIAVVLGGSALVWMYPVLLIVAILGGVVGYARRVVPLGALLTGWRDAMRFGRRQLSAAGTEVVSGAYTALAVSIVTLGASTAQAGVYVSGDKLWRMGQTVVGAQGNALQGWVVEDDRAHFGARVRARLCCTRGSVSSDSPGSRCSGRG